MGSRTGDGLALGICLALSLTAGVLGRLLGGGEPGDWYASLAKPGFTPPGWVFGPVWTALYLMMGWAAWLVWRRRRERPVALALTLFGVQLALNATWTGLFFGLRNPGLAFAELVLLWLVLVGTTGAFFRVRSAAGWLLVPYLAWVSYAAVLNGAIWWLNA